MSMEEDKMYDISDDDRHYNGEGEIAKNKQKTIWDRSGKIQPSMEGKACNIVV